MIILCQMQTEVTYIIRQHISGIIRNIPPVPAPKFFFLPNLYPNNTFLSFMQGKVTESSYAQKLPLHFLLNFLDDSGAHSEREASGDSPVFYKDLTSLGFYQGNI